MTELGESKPSDAQVAFAALQTLIQLGITSIHAQALFNAPPRTVEEMQAQLDATDATIAQVREDD